ncbi:MAG TPA: serine hydrolase domain-containing protein [Pseudomonadales bacterium]|nr:serine hydrolase domain-containing protein [Pseudomonadales bacterium]
MSWSPGTMPECVDAEQAGMSSQRLKNLNPYLQDYIDTERLAGCSVAVMRHGKLVFFENYGHARKEDATAMAADTIHRIYSMSKPITSVALLTLYEKGKFQLDDPLCWYLPEFKDMKVLTGGTAMQPITRPAQTQITIRHITTHTAGLTYGFPGVPNAVDQMYRRKLEGHFSEDLAAFCQKLATLPLRFDPGTGWNYSYATDVQGRLIEVLSGMTFAEYLQQAIFDPLGMVDTSFQVAPDKVSRFANNYHRNKGTLEVEDEHSESPYLQNRAFQSGGGGLTSTLQDYLRFALMMANKGELEGVRILGRKTVEYATMNHLPGGQDMEDMGAGGFAESAFRGVGFCLLGSTCINPAISPSMQSLGDYGWGGAAGTRWWVDPSESLTCVYMQQFMPGGLYPIQQYLRSMVLQSIIDV